MDAENLVVDQGYTVEDIFALPEGKRAELINGKLYDLAAPLAIHQVILSELLTAIKDYIREKNGGCQVLPAPFAVFLNRDNRNYVEPDISVICDKEKLDEKGCNGAPDLVVEIVSKASERMDFKIKLFKYCSAGVREYWIVNPMTETTTVYMFDQPETDEIDEEKGDAAQYKFSEEIHSAMFPDLTIQLSSLIS